MWFGWFGFNAGSALGANTDAVVSFANTNLASASSMVTWLFYDRFLNRKMSALGACIGAIVGLVAITPAAGFVTLGESVFIGFISAIISNVAITLFNKTKIDDTLDVFPSHGVGGIAGMILTGIFANDVGLTSGSLSLFYAHLLTIALVVIFTLIMSYFLLKVVDLIIPLRVRKDQEERGLDASQHGELFI